MTLFFLKFHHLQSQKTPCFLSMDVPDKKDPKPNTTTTTIHLVSSDRRGKPINRFSKKIETDGRAITDLLPSHHHLVCIGGRDKIYICNPSTEELLPLPLSSVPDEYCPAVGFGYLPSKKQYKVLKLSYHIELVNLDEPGNWLIKPVILTITTPTNNLVEFCYSPWRVLEKDCPFAADGPCVFVNGFLFWKIYMVPSDKILSFNLEKEEFLSLAVPYDVSENASSSKFSIADIRGDLWLLVGYTQRVSIMELWVLKDLEENTWTKKYRFDCTTIFGREIPVMKIIIDVHKMKLVDVRHEEEIIFEVDDHEVRELMWFHIKTKTWKSEFIKKNCWRKFCYYTDGFLSL